MPDKSLKESLAERLMREGLPQTPNSPKLYREPVLDPAIQRAINSVQVAQGREAPNVPFEQESFGSSRGYNNVNGSYSPVDGVVRLNPTMVALDSVPEIASTIAHEIKHVRDYEESDKEDWLRNKEREFYVPYNERESEVAARKSSEEYRTGRVYTPDDFAFRDSIANWLTKLSFYNNWVDPMFDFYRGRK